MEGGDDFEQIKTVIENYFDIDKIRDGESLNQYNQNSGQDGLFKSLKIHHSEGIQSETIPDRIKYFGSNIGFTQPRASIFSIIIDSLGDLVIQILIGAAIVSLIIGSISDSGSGWIEGAAIFFAVFIVISVTTVNDYIKDSQFIKLNSSVNLHKVTVTRDGRLQEISSTELVVGDLIQILPGEVLDVDGILVKSNNMKVDESAITGESNSICKSASEHNEKTSNPFIISGSKVTEGSGTLVVCAVGLNCYNEKLRQKTSSSCEEENTPLQDKLEELAVLLGKIGLAAGLLMTLILVLYISITAISESKWTKYDTQNLIDAIIIGITILVIAIPEGLPLAITLSMAYSCIRMKDENIFVRYIKGCEIMGAVTNLLIDKTGTLTENKMKVKHSWVFGKETSPNHVSQEEKALISKVISRNTTAFYKTPSKEISGSSTEGALIDYVSSLNEDINFYRSASEEFARFAFTSSSKKMTTVYQVSSGLFEVYSKGAVSEILPLCKFYHSSHEKISEINNEVLTQVTSLSDDMANKQLRLIALAYKSFHSSEQDLPQSSYESDLIFLGFLAIQDHLRKDAYLTVNRIQKSGISVRMVTGDSVETAVSIAKATGILDEDYEKSNVLTGKVFREASGGLDFEVNESGQIVEMKLKNIENFKEVVKDLKVLARCSPDDKLILAVGLKEIGEIVAVTGDGSNDAAAMKQADIGLAMMSGTQLAKQCSDIILLDDSILSVLNSVKWGRNVYSCTRKFLQFQLTLNVVALSISILGGLIVREAPITAVQMLWVNLIQDSLAALALATEPPCDEILFTKPYDRNSKIINSDMIINILSQSLFQIAVLLLVLFLAPVILNIEYGWGNEEWTETNGKHFTILFNIFVFLQLFNEINCRKVDMAELNIFKDFFNNWMFHFIFWGSVMVQLAFIVFGGEFMKCSRLDVYENLGCIAVGMSCLVFALLVRATVRLHRNISNKSFNRKNGHEYIGLIS